MKRKLFACLSLIVAAGYLTGCTVTTRNVEPEEELHYDEAYDPSDKKRIVDTLVSSLLERTPVPATSDRPVIVIYDIANRTSEHIDTSGISDDIRQAMLESGRFRFVSKVQRDNIDKETAYQYSGKVSARTRIQQAQQVGARYMMSGTLRSIEKEQPKQMRLKKKSLRYYSLHLELTDIQSGLLEWTNKVEIIREASKPFIGW